MNDIGVIHLTGKRGGFAVVDADLFEELNRHRWKLGPKGYIERYYTKDGKMKTARLHVAVNKTPPGFDTDHKNGFKIDNRRRNLRTATDGQNHANMRKCAAPRSSKFKGVSWHKASQKWRAYIEVSQESIHLGLYPDEIEAVQAYNAAAIRYFGEFALLNSIPCR